MKSNTSFFYDDRGHLIVRPYRLKDLAAIYGVSTYTMKKWIKAHAKAYSDKTRKYYSVLQVRAILDALGHPHKLLPTPIAKYKQAA